MTSTKNINAMVFTQIKETCLYVHDLIKTKEFYGEKLGLELYSFVNNSHVFFRVGSSMLLCFLNNTIRKQNSLPPQFATGQIHFAFEAGHEDYENCKATIITKGIIIEHEHIWKNNVKSFYFRDPDHHLVEVVEPALWE